MEHLFKWKFNYGKELERLRQEQKLLTMETNSFERRPLKCVKPRLQNEAHIMSRFRLKSVLLLRLYWPTSRYIAVNPYWLHIILFHKRILNLYIKR